MCRISLILPLAVLGGWFLVVAENVGYDGVGRIGRPARLYAQVWRERLPPLLCFLLPFLFPFLTWTRRMYVSVFPVSEKINQRRVCGPGPYKIREVRLGQWRPAGCRWGMVKLGCPFSSSSYSLLGCHQNNWRSMARCHS
jgi:hypothetical protein